MAKTSALEHREKEELEGEGTRPGPVFRPDVDVLERPEGFVIYADLPGADDGSVEVRLEKGTLSLDAQLAISPEDRWTPLHTEYRPGAYHREFRISEEIDANAVSATMRKGVLELYLPKAAKRQPRAIRIQAG